MFSRVGNKLTLKYFFHESLQFSDTKHHRLDFLGQNLSKNIFFQFNVSQLYCNSKKVNIRGRTQPHDHENHQSEPNREMVSYRHEDVDSVQDSLFDFVD